MRAKLTILIISSIMFMGADWYHFDIETYAPRDKKTNQELSSKDLQKYRNRKGVDEIIPGGAHLPSIVHGKNKKIYETYEKGNQFMILTDEIPEQKDKDAFESKKLTPQEANDYKTNIFNK